MQLVRDRKAKLATTSMAVLKMSIQYCCDVSRTSGHCAMF